jgi:hypothetical protein
MAKTLGVYLHDELVGHPLQNKGGQTGGESRARRKMPRRGQTYLAFMGGWSRS